MKSIFLFLFIVFNCTAFSYGQAKECNDAKLHSELVTLNETFENQGFKLSLFNIISIPEKAYLPISVTMKQGKMYQINYIVQEDYKNYTMILIDKNKKEIFKLDLKSKKTKNHYSTQGLIAPYSGDYWLILTQKVKGQKQACAGISVMESMN